MKVLHRFLLSDYTIGHMHVKDNDYFIETLGYVVKSFR